MKLRLKRGVPMFLLRILIDLLKLILMIQQVLPGNTFKFFHFLIFMVYDVLFLLLRSDDMLRYELELRGEMDGTTDDSSNYHYCKV